MKKVIKDLSKVLFFALLWFASAYFATEVWLPTPWALNCGAINVAISLITLFLITRTEEGARLFYDGPSNGGWVIIAVVWSIPGVIFFAGVIWWTIRLILQLLGLWQQL